MTHVIAKVLRCAPRLAPRYHGRAGARTGAGADTPQQQQRSPDIFTPTIRRGGHAGATRHTAGTCVENVSPVFSRTPLFVNFVGEKMDHSV